MRILHVGNIANNAYNNAKFLRRKGVEADVLCYDYTHIMGQPEWEDASFEGQPDEFHPDWEQFDLGTFRRPAWFLQARLFPETAKRRQLFKGQFLLERLLKQPPFWIKIWGTYLRCLATGSTPPPRVWDLVPVYVARRRFEQWFDGYDLIQAYATEPIHAWLFGKGRPFVAFEHGTMRDLPFEDSARGRLLSLAYRQAGKIIITNPDVITAAQRLGLTRFLFIPHPVDETKYRPSETPLRRQLESAYQTDLVLFAPSRHNWALKGNDRLIRAFARLLSAVRVKPILILTAWGQEVEQSERLIKDLGVQDRVVWTPPLNKMTLIHHYNAADVVLDQFTIGTFGTVTPEAMACARPVVMHFDRHVHEWCYSEMPPVVAAQTEDEIFERLVALGSDRAYRRQQGATSRDWIVKYHGWEHVADRQIAVYRELLNR